MGEKLVSGTTVLGLLRAKLNGRTVRDVARELGVAPSFLQEVVGGQKGLGSRIPAHFGLRPVTLYEWTDEGRRQARP